MLRLRHLTLGVVMAAVGLVCVSGTGVLCAAALQWVWIDWRLREVERRVGLRAEEEGDGDGERGLVNKGLEEGYRRD